MTTLIRRVIAGVRAVVARNRVDRDLDAELKDFLETGIERKMRDGMSRAAAERAVRIELGSVAFVKDQVRDVGWESFIESSGRDVRYAIRGLRRSPGFTSTAVLTLALGIGATTAIFSLLHTVLFKSLPVSNPQELVLARGVSLYPAFQGFRRHTDIFVDLFASSGVTPLDVDVQRGGSERADVSLVSGSYFSVLGVRPAIGRTFTVDDDLVPGEHSVAVASHAYWQRRFGGDTAAIGRTVRISGKPMTIIGVTPPGFFGEHVGVAPDLWVPLTMWGHIVPGRNLLESPGTGWLQVFGRVRPGVATSGLQPALTATFRQVLTGIFGEKAGADIRRDIAAATVVFEPAARGVSDLRRRFARPLQLLMGAVLLVLLIACANIANLLLARAAARRHEIDLRVALGMSRGRLVRQVLTESLVLAALGGAAGMFVAWIGRETLLRLISTDGSRLPVAVAIDARLLMFVLAISCTTAILFGLAPAWRSARGTVVTSLRARQDAGGRSGQRLNALLVVAQVAMSLVLLTGAGMFLQTIGNLRDIDLGFVPQRLLIVDVDPRAASEHGDQAVALHRRLLDSLAGIPGVSSVSLSEHGVLTGRENSTDLMRPKGFVGGPDGFPRTSWDVVGPRYFSTIGARLRAGRDFSEHDDARAPAVVAINNEMARLFFADTNPIGQRLVWGDGARQKELEIVAVADDVKQGGPRNEPQPHFYLPYFQLPVVRDTWMMSSTRFLVRSSADGARLAPVIAQLMTSENPRLSVTSLDTGTALVRRTLRQERMVATLLVAFGVLAIGLACLGLYGLIAYQVVQRRNEIGTRMALGAQRRQVLWVALRPGLVWVAAGVAAGIPMAVAASRAAQGLLFGLTAADPGPLLTAAGVMAAMGMLAAFLPARRASRLDPVSALRSD